MWSNINIMRDKGVPITYWQFLRWMAPVGALSLTAALLVLWAEFAGEGW